MSTQRNAARTGKSATAPSREEYPAATPLRLQLVGTRCGNAGYAHTESATANSTKPRPPSSHHLCMPLYSLGMGKRYSSTRRGSSPSCRGLRERACGSGRRTCPRHVAKVKQDLGDAGLDQRVVGISLVWQHLPTGTKTVSAMIIPGTARRWTNAIWWMWKACDSSVALIRYHSSTVPRFTTMSAFDGAFSPGQIDPQEWMLLKVRIRRFGNIEGLMRWKLTLLRHDILRKRGGRRWTSRAICVRVRHEPSGRRMGNDCGRGIMTRAARCVAGRRFRP